MKPREIRRVKGLIDAARVRQGLTQKQMCYLMAVPESSFVYRRDSGKLTLDDIRRVHRVAPFNFEELDELIRG